MPEQTQAAELTELLEETVDADIEWGNPKVDVHYAVSAILERWVLVPRTDPQA